MSLDKTLQDIFDADNALRAAEDRLLGGKPAEVSKLLARAVEDAKKLADHDIETSATRLIRLADLCAQVPGPEMSDALIRILDEDEPGVRGAAADALLDVAYDRYAEVARAIDRALDNAKAFSGAAFTELPFLIAEVGEPSALLLLRRFLAIPDADVVASAIEACAQLGDPAAIPFVEKFTKDPRLVSLGEEDEAAEIEIGELAKEAIDALREADQNSN